MTKLLAIIVLLAALPFACGQPAPPTPPVVILPDAPSPPAPPPSPVGAPIKLDAGVLYVVRSNASCIVITSPPGLLKVSAETGPMKIRDVFYGGSGVKGVKETRTFIEKNLWFVEATGSGLCELIVIPAGATVEKDVIRRTIEANVGPRPPPVPPDPGPGPKPPTPDPTPTPAPIPLAGFRVLIVYDPATLTPAQEGIAFGQKVRSYLQSHCVVGADGKTKDFWIIQSGVDVSAAPKWIADVIQRHPGQRTFMVISDGKTGYDGAIPADAEAALAIMQKIGGP